jgi:hypothetical protein
MPASHLGPADLLIDTAARLPRLDRQFDQPLLAAVGIEFSANCHGEPY